MKGWRQREEWRRGRQGGAGMETRADGDGGMANGGERDRGWGRQRDGDELEKAQQGEAERGSKAAGMQETCRQGAAERGSATEGETEGEGAEEAAAAAQEQRRREGGRREGAGRERGIGDEQCSAGMEGGDGGGRHGWGYGNGWIDGRMNGWKEGGREGGREVMRDG